VRILLIEDEDHIASFITKGLSTEGHVVDRVGSASEGLCRSLEREHDLILLDLMLPDREGHVILEKMRTERVTTPVLVVSARETVDDKVRLLDLGASDYLTKPFAYRELAARVRALTRHDHGRSDLLEVGDLALDTRARRVTRHGRSFDLPARQFALLEYLMRHADQVMTRQELLDAVWGINFYTESNVVDVYVLYLRRKLDDGGGPSVIETVRGVGYRVRG